ncbi:hypothetical protein CYMTET_21717 [Cymbomonas tetramitiformis]|uniref:Uncharacterized protein n=1 Tax=Cymbomonas tetramitiformis TaxID=36881 RepID=A0AAE0G202_9CHLO|nr:hypothetical protein CYMTET_21717 [Cymbomonas tetramitiformis]
MYNLMNCFKNSDWGILITDWQQLPNEEKDTYRAAQVPDDKKNSTVKAEALKAEYQGVVAARQTASLQRYTKIVDHREAPGPSPAAATSSRVTSTAAGDVNVDAFVDELHTLSLEVGAAACVNQEKTKMIAAPAVALGSTQKMRGFPVKTPEEFDAEAQVPRAPAADEIVQRGVQLMASLLKSTRKAFHKMSAGMVRQGYITAPRDIETLVELAGAGQLPMPAALAADRGDCESDADEDEEDPGSLVSGSDSDEEEIPLDEMPEDVVDQPKKRRASITAASAAIQGSHGVEDFSVTGRVHAENMGAQAYELLKERMLSGLTEEQITAMAQLVDLLRGRREANVATRGEWSESKELVNTTTGEPTEQRGRTLAQTDPGHPDLTREQKAASDAEYLSASVQPWLGMAVNPCSGEAERGWELDSAATISWIAQAMRACANSTFCVLSEKTKAHWELMESLVRHTEGSNERMAPMGSVSGEFQLPFYYKKDQRWRYQPLKYIQKVDVMNLKLKYDEVLAGRQTAPLLALSDLTCKVERFYPVTDGEGGHGLRVTRVTSWTAMGPGEHHQLGHQLGHIIP